QAQKNFEAAIQQQPKEAAGYLALAQLYGRQKKINEAYQTVEAGLRQAPNNLDLLIGKAGLLEFKGEYDAAIALYESMLKDQPGAMIVVNNLASLLADHRTDKESLARAGTLAAALKNSPVAQFKDTVGWVNYLQGDNQSALPLLEDAAAKLPNSADVQYHL